MWTISGHYTNIGHAQTSHGTDIRWTKDRLSLTPVVQWTNTRWTQDTKHTLDRKCGTTVFMPNQQLMNYKCQCCTGIKRIELRHYKVEFPEYLGKSTYSNR